MKNWNQQIVCITYTNVAKDEIIERIERNELILVKTIHDFLWDCIKNFQKELNIKLIELIEEKRSEEQRKLDGYTARAVRSRERSEEKISKHQEALDKLNTRKTIIRYENFPRYSEGKISHDDLILIAEKIFSSYPKIRKITADSYPIVLVDEYQDTQKETVQILLKYLLESTGFIVGFFGDKRQQIYDKGIGEIPGEYNLRLIQKRENYRSSKEVIDLLNNLRSDIEQYQPSQNTRNGDIAFYYQPTTDDFNAINFIESNLKGKWDITSNIEIKILYLTHRFISKEKQYEELFQHYSRANKRDYLIRNKDNRAFCPFADFLFDLEELVDLYTTNKIQQLLKKSFSTLTHSQTKKDLMNCSRASVK